MKVSYFETARYLAPQPPPPEWPVPPGAYDAKAGAQAYQGMIQRLKYVEELGFDWVSVSEHHYSPRIRTPNPNISASFLAARSEKIKIAVLGPIVLQSNPVQVAEELAMLDNLAQGRLIVGLLRGTTNEYLTYGLNPAEARERTTEGMELILKAWTEPQPFGWQGRHFQYRTVSVWLRPLQQPHPQTYSLGTSAQSCELAVRHHIGLGVSFARLEIVSRSTRYYREQCTRYGWEPTPAQIVYRANILLAETDEEAEKELRELVRPAAARQRHLQHVRPRRDDRHPLIVVAMFKGYGISGVLFFMIGLLVIQIVVVWAWGIEPAKRGLDTLTTSTGDGLRRAVRA